MNKTMNWMKVLGASALVIGSMAGCGNGEAGDNNGVSNAIKSPVMDKEDDKSTAGTDAASGNVTTGGATGNTATGNGATGNGANSKMGSTATGKSGSTMVGGNAGAGKMGSGKMGANSNNGVSNAIKSPVMGKNNDKAIAGNTAAR